MPLPKGAHNALKVFKKLMTEKPGTARKKAIKTIAEKHGVPQHEAKRRQAAAIMKSIMK